MEILIFCFFLKNLNCSLKKKKKKNQPGLLLKIQIKSMYIFFHIFITVELISLLNWIKSHQLFLNKLFIIIKSPCNHLEKNFINLMSQQFN